MNQTVINKTQETFENIIAQMQQQYDDEQKSVVTLPDDFICLTDPAGTPIYLNRTYIQSFHRQKDWEYTFVIMNGTTHEFVETPKEIADLLLKSYRFK